MPSIPVPPARLSDEVVALRGIAEWDIPEILIAYQDDRELHVSLGRERQPTGAELGRQVERSEAERLAGSTISLTLVEPGGNDCRGRLDVSGIDWEAGSAELSVWVAPGYRGQGLAAHALALVEDWLRAEVGLQTLTVRARVDD